MKHYDGPAFYRRFVNNSRSAKQSQKKEAPNQISQISHSQKAPTKFSPAFDESEMASNKIAQLTQAFTPRHDYKRKSHSIDRRAPRVNAFYHKLITELQKQPADCILMETFNSQGSIASVKYHLADDKEVSREQSIASDSLATANETFASSNAEIVSETAHSTSVITEKDSRAAPLDQFNANDERVSKSSLRNESNSTIDESANDAPFTSNVSSFNGDVAENLADSLSQDNDRSSMTSADSDADSSVEMPDIEDKSHVDENEVVSSSNRPASMDNDNYNDETDNEEQDNVASDDVEEMIQYQTSHDNNHHALGHSLDSIIDAEEHQNQNTNLFNKPVATTENQNYQLPHFTLLNEPQKQDDDDLDEWILKQSDVLDQTLKAFNVDGEVVDWTNGPTVTRFQVKLKLGVKVSRITNLNDDLKMALAAKDIRIEAPIPGRRTVGVEIPNPKPRPVMLSEVLETSEFQDAKSPLTAALGVDLSGTPQVTDVRKMPHGLIAGATGSGKSVFINSLLVSLLYKATPADLKMILIDPKAVEMAPYNGIPHLLAPVISEPNEASAALKWAVKEMDERYERLAASGARNIEQYNQQAIDHHQPNLKMPYILIVIDELADLMMVASTEVQEYIVRITQKARAAGIHLIVATQRPSVDIITGTIKNNIPTRVAFMVSSQIDSRTIIDTAGAERLLGKGDMLFLGNGKSQSIRLQGTFVTNQEIERVTEFVKHQQAPKYAFNPKSLLKRVNQAEKQDDIFPQVLKYISGEKNVSTSKLQRVFSIGYNRAASLIDDLEQHGYVSGQHGSKPREIYLTPDEYQKLNL